jgi:hypothetical protein
MIVVTPGTVSVEAPEPLWWQDWLAECPGCGLVVKLEAHDRLFLATTGKPPHRRARMLVCPTPGCRGTGPLVAEESKQGCAG